MKELLRLIGAQANTSTAYHPRTDGQSERSNQWLGQFLRPWSNIQQDNWEPYLPIAEFAHNSWRSKTTRQSPFQILMGYNPRAEVSDVPTSLPILELRRDIWKKARADTERLIIQAQKRWAQSKREGHTFKQGDQVWLEGRNLHLDQPLAKLAPKRHGPFTIKKVLSPITYQLTLPHQWKIHNIFHVDLLTPYVETEFHGPNYTRPPPDLIEGEEEYEVESILKSRHHGRGRKVQYLVKWKGYPDSDNEWVNWDNVHAEEALEEFKRTQPEAVTHKRAIQMMAKDLFPATLMSTNTSTITSASSHAQDLAEAIARFPAVIPGSPDHSSASPSPTLPVHRPQQEPLNSPLWSSVAPHPLALFPGCHSWSPVVTHPPICRLTPAPHLKRGWIEFQ
jgi:hypothetical protein